MKKRFFILLLVCALACTSVFAANSQKIFSVDDDIYSDIADLYLLTGHALPSTTGPWSATELLAMVNKLDFDSIPLSLQYKYYEILGELNEKPEIQWKGIGATFSNELNLQLAFHTNNDSKWTMTSVTNRDSETDVDTTYTERAFIGRDNWASDYIHNLYPLYGLDWETWVEDSIYSYFKFGLYNSYNGSESNDFGTTKLASNIVMFQNFKFEPGFIDANFPYRGFFSAGSEHWSLEVGRDKISWGAGTTGNMTISNNLLYHNMARFTAFTDSYKYTFLTSFFPHPQNYYLGTDQTENGDGEDDGVDTTGYFRSKYYNYTTGQDGLDGISMYMAHRIEGRFINDKLNIALTEAVMYESATNHIDLVAVSPMYIFHNAYTPNVANSTLAFEFDYTPIKGLNVYGQLLVDEFALPILEKAASAEKKCTPSRFGYLAGVSYVTPWKGGIFKANAEYAKVDPYTYLKNNVDYVVPIRLWSTALTDVAWNEYFLGYTYGCDSRVFNLNLDYSKGPLNVNFNILEALHGTHDQWTKIRDNDTGGNGADAWKADSTTCTTNEEWGSKRYSTSKTAVKNTLDISLGASYEGFYYDNLTVYGQADLIRVMNVFNMQGWADSDFQFVLGAKYEF